MDWKPGPEPPTDTIHSKRLRSRQRMARPGLASELRTERSQPMKCPGAVCRGRRGHPGQASRTVVTITGILGTRSKGGLLPGTDHSAPRTGTAHPEKRAKLPAD